MQLQPNILFHNRYLLIRKIGRGGYSEVWLAEDKYSRLQVAIKIYAPGAGMDDDGITIFSQELANVYNFNHSNLLKPQHFDVCEGQPYLILPYCEGGSCKKRIGQMTENAMLRFLHDVAAGLNYLHELTPPVIHQDIKPDNVLIDSDGHYLITDFGISTKARNTLRKSVIIADSNSQAGTIAYMAPERSSRNNTPIKASDIWALGASAFELMNGDVPFGDLGGMMQRSGAEIPYLKEYYSQPLRELVEQMLALETWDRPTAEQIIQRTDELLKSNIRNGVGNSQPSVSVTPPTSDDRETRRRGPAPEVPDNSTVSISTVDDDRDQQPAYPSTPSTPSNPPEPPKPKKKKGWIWAIISLVVAIVIGIGIDNYKENKRIERERIERERIEREREDDWAYDACKTVYDYGQYLKSYPNGRNRTLAENIIRYQQETNGPIKITKIEFRNIGENGEELSTWGNGNHLEAPKLKYLQPRITFDNMYLEVKQLDIYCKIYDKYNNLSRNPDISPSGYTWKHTIRTDGDYKKGEVETLTGWGYKYSGTYSIGQYRVELWLEGKKIYSTTINL